MATRRSPPRCENKRVDAVALTTEEYQILGSQWGSTKALLGTIGGLFTREYVLLVRSEGHIGRIEDLRGRS